MEITSDLLFTTVQFDMCIFIFIMGRRETGNKQDGFLQIFIRRVNMEACCERETLTIYGSYINFRKNMIS